MLRDRPGRGSGGLPARLTADDAEELLDAHPGVEAVEESLDVALPPLQTAAGRRAERAPGALSQKDATEPANHLLDPLGQGREGATPQMGGSAGRERQNREGREIGCPSPPPQAPTSPH